MGNKADIIRYRSPPAPVVREDMHASLKARIARNLSNISLQNPAVGKTVIRDFLRHVCALEDVSMLPPSGGMSMDDWYFKQVIDELIESLSSQDRRVTMGGQHFLIVVDLDSLSGMDESYGSGFTAAALRHVTKTLMSMVRDSDSVCRIGSDEFAVILRNTTQEGAHGKILQINSAFENMYFSYAGLDIAISAGVEWTVIDPSVFKKDIMKRIEAYIRAEGPPAREGGPLSKAPAGRDSDYSPGKTQHLS